MSNLPEARLAFNELPFTSTGIYYFGPPKITQGRCTRSIEGTPKRTGAIFTCLRICCSYRTSW